VRRLVLALLALLAAGPAAAEFRLTVLHTNDVHGRLEPANRFGAPCRPQDVAEGTCYGGTARLAAAVAGIREEAAAAGSHVLLLDGGDQFQGTLFYTRYKGIAEARAMNLLGYDAMSLGNHEFDDGPEILGRFLGLVRFPVLAANLDVAAEPALAGRVARFAVLERGGRRIGIVGAVTADTPTVSRPGPRVGVGAVEPAVQAAVAALRAAGVDIVFLLSHVGLELDRELARRIEGLDLVVGGHSHSVLGDGLPGAQGPYPAVEMGPAGGPVPVVQAGAWGRYLGRLDLAFDAAGRLLRWQGAPLELGVGVPAAPAAAAMVAELARPLAALRQEIVGLSLVDLPADACREAECALGNLVADAMLAEAKSRGAVAAIQNGGGLRAGIAAGPVSRGHVLETLPFGNTLSVFALSGADLRAALEHGVSAIGGAGGGRFPQVAGLRYAFDPRRPAGGRILSVEVADGAGGFRPVVAEARYTVVANDFLRRGGDGYAMFRDRAVDPYDFGRNLEDVLVDHLARLGPAAPALEGRIRRSGG